MGLEEVLASFETGEVKNVLCTSVLLCLDTVPSLFPLFVGLSLTLPDDNKGEVMRVSVPLCLEPVPTFVTLSARFSLAGPGLEKDEADLVPCAAPSLGLETIQVFFELSLRFDASEGGLILFGEVMQGVDAVTKFFTLSVGFALVSPDLETNEAESEVCAPVPLGFDAVLSCLECSVGSLGN